MSWGDPAWQPERAEALKALLAAGLSYNQTARCLGVTKGAVAGFCARNGIHSEFPSGGLGEKMARKNGWPAERVAELHRLLGEGKSIAAIMEILNVSKNMVTSKISRDNLFHLRPRFTAVQGAGALNTPRLILAKGPGQAAPKHKPAWAPPPVPRPRGCQWPLWPDKAKPDGKFCAAALAPGGSYCPEHHRLSLNSG